MAGFMKSSYQRMAEFYMLLDLGDSRPPKRSALAGVVHDGTTCPFWCNLPTCPGSQCWCSQLWSLRDKAVMSWSIIGAVQLPQHCHTPHPQTPAHHSRASPSRTKSDLCWYHNCLRKRIHKCRYPCEWSGKSWPAASTNFECRPTPPSHYWYLQWVKI